LDRRKKVNLLMQYSLSKHPDLPNVPLVTLRGYVRDAELFRDHAGAGLL
jgi:hypothetical protein